MNIIFILSCSGPPITFEKSFWNKLFAKLYNENVAARPNCEYLPFLISLFSSRVIYLNRAADTVTIYESLRSDSYSFDIYSSIDATED
jgi:hypothetical protein